MEQQSAKLEALDGLRALGTIGIFLFHSGFLLNGTFPVTLFFMLSGFMMYFTKHDLVQYRSYNEWLLKYVKRKWTEFYPLHLITFVLSLFVGGVFAKTITKNTITSMLLNLLLIHPFFPEYALTYNGLCWYLAVTMFLYTIGYFLIRITKVIPLKFGLAFTTILIIAINLFSRFNELYLYTNPIYRILDFLLGMFIAKTYLCIQNDNIYI